MTRYCWRCAAALPGPPPCTCPNCRHVHYANAKPCGDAVVIYSGRLLLMRRAHAPEAGAWDVPGGFCEVDEHPMHAAERELLEEVGLVGRATAYIGAWMDVYGEPEPDGALIHTVVSAYIVALEDPDAQPRLQAEEALEARWFALDALPERLAFERHARPMLAAAVALVSGGGPPGGIGGAGSLPDRTW